MKKLVFALCTALFALNCQAQVVTVKGVGSVSYQKKLTPVDKDKALQIAQVAAVERYFAEAGEAESQNFDAIEGTVKANLDKFILESAILNEQDIPGLNKYSVTLRVSLNVPKLKNAIKASTATAKTSNADKSQMVYVFVARQVASVKAFDDRVVKRAEVTQDASFNASVNKKGSDSESVKGNSVTTKGGKEIAVKASRTESINVETGGSTTRRADDVGYRLLSMGNQKTATTSVFSQAGFAVADPEFVLGDNDFKAVNDDYSKGNDLSPSTMRGVVKSLRANNIPYLVVATFDVNEAQQDSATGLQKVGVSVTGRVLDLTSGLPREIAAVAPVQFFGLGPDNASATTKALKEASLSAAKEVVARLNAAGIH